MAPVAGALLALAFPRAGAWWVAAVGLVPVLVLAATAPGGREAAIRGWLSGVGFFLAVHHWLVPVVGPFALPLAGALGALWVPVAVLARRLLRPPLSTPRLAAAAVVVPSVWVAGEAVRSWEHLGGPWALLGASQWSNRPVLAFAAVAGVWGLSWVLVAANVGLTALVLGGPSARAAGVLLAVAALGGAVVAGRAATPGEAPGGASAVAIDVAVVQPGRIDGPHARLAAHEDATRALAGSGADLVVWGESSVGFDPEAHPEVVGRIADVAAAVDALVLVNVDARRPEATGGRGGIFKSSLLVGPQGPLARYDKVRLVPFGEYVPLRAVLGWVGRFTEAAPEDRRRGKDAAVMPAGGVSVGPLVCFESAFPDLTRALAGRGADVVVVQSATTTFQGSWAQPQHASLAAVRAVETGRPVVHAAVSGVSAVFDARGRRLAWLEPGARGAVVRLPLGSGATPYVRSGDWLPPASIAVAASALFLTGRVGRRRASVVSGASQPGGGGSLAADGTS